MDLKLKGKQALISGASKGIGFAVAECLAAEGCELILVARSLEALKRSQQRIQERVGDCKVQILSFDLAQSDSCGKLARDYPDASILVNNAGAIAGGDLAAVDEATWRSGWDLKVFGYINLTRDYYSLMSERGRGVIINVIGYSAERPDHKTIARSAAHGALAALTRALGSASPSKGVRVVGISPGWVATERVTQSMRKRAEAELGDPERWKEFLNELPFGRAAKAEEIAASVAFLASDLSAYTSGTILTVDGGLSSRPCI